MEDQGGERKLVHEAKRLVEGEKLRHVLIKGQAPAGDVGAGAKNNASLDAFTADDDYILCGWMLRAAGVFPWDGDGYVDALLSTSGKYVGANSGDRNIFDWIGLEINYIATGVGTNMFELAKQHTVMLPKDCRMQLDTGDSIHLHQSNSIPAGSQGGSQAILYFVESKEAGER